MRPGTALGALLGCLALAAGCGGSVGPSVGGAGALPTPSGSLAIALPGGPGPLDPLKATTPDEQLLVRQINEPLVERLSGPYDDVRSVPGPALAVRPSSRATEWRIRLRPGIRFQDGARLDAGAVLVNATRWRTTPEGRALLPGLVAVDAPRPDLVRFFLDSPDPAFGRSLASPRLGLVSPRALLPRSGDGATLKRTMGTGTGPFELRQRSANTVVIARNVGLGRPWTRSSFATSAARPCAPGCFGVARSRLRLALTRPTPSPWAAIRCSTCGGIAPGARWGWSAPSVASTRPARCRPSRGSG
jgi:ABC-type transport system substrate-binding protein